MENKNYCAFLRGVNVNGTTMKMQDVCSVFEKAGMTKVNSILASGNIIFSSNKNKKELKLLLEKAMSKHFNYEAFLFLKERTEIGIIIKNNPFIINKDYHNYCFIGVDEIEKVLIEKFNSSTKIKGEEAQINSNTFYWKVSKGNTLESEFGKILGQKNLKNSFTSRNINTIEKVLNKM
jgi:uncharacterized protein (DUF1697 family)